MDEFLQRFEPVQIHQYMSPPKELTDPSINEESPARLLKKRGQQVVIPRQTDSD